MSAIIGTIIEWVLSRLFGGGEKSQIRDDDVKLGSDENELLHVKQENADRAAIAGVKPANPDDAADRLSKGKF